MKSVLVMTALAMATAANAQERMQSAEKPFRAALGIYSPTGSAFRDAAGSAMPMLSLSYDAGKTLSERPILYGVYLDHAQNRKGGTNNSVTAFGVSARYLFSPPLTATRSYLGAGVGSYNVKVGSSNSKIGGKVFGGFERNDGYYGEIAYHMVPRVQGADPSALAFSIGRRF